MSVEPRIQYAKTSDGLSIAHWAMGEGPPLVVMPATPFTHIELEWKIPDSRRWLEALMAGRRLVRYDGRGFGLSDRTATDFTLEAQCLDLDAVADALGLTTFPLFAMGDSGMIAMAYAATRAERVSQLVLWCSWATRTDIARDARTRTLRSLIEQDWIIYTETAASVLLGWNETDAARRFAEFYRECAEPQVILRSIDTVYASDATPYLARIACPTLVMHRKGLPAVGVDAAQHIAAGVPGANLVLLEGNSPLPFLGDMDSIVAYVHDFLGDSPAARATAVPELGHGSLVTLMFTDMEGSTALTQRLGDALAQEVLRKHNAVIRDALRAHAGREIKHTGDGIMASFGSAIRALECAIGIQRGIAEGDVRVRVGLNAGEPVAEDEDLFGTSVQLAARVCGQAEPGQVLVSNVVRELAAGKGFLFSDRGDAALRGFEDPVRLYELRWEE